MVLIAVWFVSIITLFKYPLPGFGDSLPSTSQTETTIVDSKDKFEETLRRIDNSNKGDKKTNKSHSGFRGKFLCNDTYFVFFFYL